MTCIMRLKCSSSQSTMPPPMKATPGQPLGYLLSQFDGVVGWLVCGWTALAGCMLAYYYSRRSKGSS